MQAVVCRTSQSPDRREEILCHMQRGAAQQGPFEGSSLANCTLEAFRARSQHPEGQGWGRRLCRAQHSVGAGSKLPNGAVEGGWPLGDCQELGKGRALRTVQWLEGLVGLALGFQLCREAGAASQLFLTLFPSYPPNTATWPLSSTTPSWTRSCEPC